MEDNVRKMHIVSADFGEKKSHCLNFVIFEHNVFLKHFFKYICSFSKKSISQSSNCNPYFLLIQRRTTLRSKKLLTPRLKTIYLRILIKIAYLMVI